jgi:hypothetical protein
MCQSIVAGQRLAAQAPIGPSSSRRAPATRCRRRAPARGAQDRGPVAVAVPPLRAPPARRLGARGLVWFGGGPRACATFHGRDGPVPRRAGPPKTAAQTLMREDETCDPEERICKVRQGQGRCLAVRPASGSVAAACGAGRAAACMQAAGHHRAARTGPPRGPACFKGQEPRRGRCMRPPACNGRRNAAHLATHPPAPRRTAPRCPTDPADARAHV